MSQSNGIWNSVVRFTEETVVSSTITISTPVVCNAHTSYYTSTTLLSPDRVLVCYVNFTDKAYLYSLIITCRFIDRYTSSTTSI